MNFGAEVSLLNLKSCTVLECEQDDLHMIDDLKLKNFGPLPKVEWSGLGKINLVIGGQWQR